MFAAIYKVLPDKPIAWRDVCDRRPRDGTAVRRRQVPDRASISARATWPRPTARPARWWCCCCGSTTRRRSSCSGRVHPRLCPALRQHSGSPSGRAATPIARPCTSCWRCRAQRGARRPDGSNRSAGQWNSSSASEQDASGARRGLAAAEADAQDADRTSRPAAARGGVKITHVGSTGCRPTRWHGRGGANRGDATSPPVRRSFSLCDDVFPRDRRSMKTQSAENGAANRDRPSTAPLRHLLRPR